MKVLLSEGSSLSARETITALGLRGQNVDILTINWMNLGQFSWFVKGRYPVPRAGADPLGYLAKVREVVTGQGIDVLIPVHEQAYLFAARRDLIPKGVGIALASFQSFEQVQSKSRFVTLLNRLGVPQPQSDTIAVGTLATLVRPFPFYVKAIFGTASVGVWRISDAAEQARVAEALLIDGVSEVVVQSEVLGHLERAQAIFDHGRLVACHTYRQLIAGPGGGDILKTSVVRPEAVAHIETIGGELAWHGALSFDYILDERTETPTFIDANPRLVEPMNGLWSGVDLAGALVDISAGKSPPRQPAGKAGVRTCLGLMGLFDASSRRFSRLDVLREAFLLLTRRGRYRGAREELTPVGADPLTFLALWSVTLVLLVSPRHATKFTEGAVRNYSLTPETIRRLQAWNAARVESGPVPVGAVPLPA